jgi:hypothetical protein
MLMTNAARQGAHGDRRNSAQFSESAVIIAFGGIDPNCKVDGHPMLRRDPRLTKLVRASHPEKCDRIALDAWLRRQSIHTRLDELLYKYINHAWAGGLRSHRSQRTWRAPSTLNTSSVFIGIYVLKILDTSA